MRDDAQFRRVMHDLRAPILTIGAFVSELEAVATELAAAGADASSTADMQASVNRLVGDDVRPCLDCIATAVGTLSALVDSLEAVTPDT